MTDTRTGRIYKIVCSKSNDVYVGSTLNALRTRMSQHKRSFESGKGLSNYSSFKQHGWASLKMILIETYEVVDRNHLMVYETLWFNKLRAVNERTPFQPLRKEVLRELCRQCYNKNKTKIKAKVIERTKSRTKEERDIALAYSKQYYQENKEKYRGYAKSKHIRC
jgi:hypothetical protein